MTKPLSEGEKWVWFCNADEDNSLCCHVTDPNAWLEQRCQKCPDGQRKRVLIGSDQDPEKTLKEVEDWESEFIYNHTIGFLEDQIKRERENDKS